MVHLERQIINPPYEKLTQQRIYQILCKTNTQYKWRTIGEKPSSPRKWKRGFSDSALRAYVSRGKSPGYAWLWEGFARGKGVRCEMEPEESRVLYDSFTILQSLRNQLSPG